MSAHDYIPQAFEELDIWLTNFTDYLSEQTVQARLGITPTQLNELQVYTVAYHSANANADLPNAGPADRIIRREAAATAIAQVRHFVNRLIRYNDALTDADRIQMGLTVPDTSPTPTTPPDSYPQATIRLPHQCEIELHYADSAAPTGSRAKPPGVHGAEIRQAILPAPPTEDDQLVQSDFSTRSPHAFTYNLSQRGQTVYYRLRWETTRGMKGPWSPILSAIIP
ncbi:MAG: hypothetical protein LBR84_00735 [Tannerella sp.]|jgi:hypothetical protein|nr:hypothetical protein [Tannerella sp.]